ncbi:hypothetical protein ES703_18825 [subsurface metagenome]
MKIYEFQKSALEKVIIEIIEYCDKEFLNIRVWYDASRGVATNWKPSPKGLTISFDLLPELKKGIDKAIGKMKERNGA